MIRNFLKDLATLVAVVAFTTGVMSLALAMAPILHAIHQEK